MTRQGSARLLIVAALAGALGLLAGVQPDAGAQVAPLQTRVPPGVPTRDDTPDRGRRPTRTPTPTPTAIPSPTPTVAPTPTATPAPADAVCFAATGHCVAGHFRAFWEQNGGLPVFGYPVTPARPEVNRDAGQTVPTQWFERARFELHGDRVLLGRLGDERLGQLGVDWRALPGDATPPGDCRLFPETGQRLCDQEPGPDFKQYWEGHGLDLGDPGVSEREALALFGLPLTRAREETNSSGGRVLTQWFERARFEWVPGQAAGSTVLLGLLGREIACPGLERERAVVVSALPEADRPPASGGRGAVECHADGVTAEYAPAAGHWLAVSVRRHATEEAARAALGPPNITLRGRPAVEEATAGYPMADSRSESVAWQRSRWVFRADTFDDTAYRLVGTARAAAERLYDEAEAARLFGVNDLPPRT